MVDKMLDHVELEHANRRYNTRGDIDFFYVPKQLNQKLFMYYCYLTSDELNIDETIFFYSSCLAYFEKLKKPIMVFYFDAQQKMQITDHNMIGSAGRECSHNRVWEKFGRDTSMNDGQKNLENN